MLRLLFLIFCVASLHSSAAFAADTPRVHWAYQVPAGERGIIDQGDGQWILRFPNGTKADLVELSRTEEYIELRNPSNQNVMRLFEDHGKLGKTSSGTFKKFTEGRWIESTTNLVGGFNNAIHVVYFVPRDRTPTPNYEQKIRVIVQLMAEIMTADLKSKGYQTDGPQFESKNGQIVVHPMRAEKNASDYNQNGAWKSGKHGGEIFSEVQRRMFPAKDHMTLIFAETYDEAPSPRLWPGHIALASARPPNGGIAVFSAWILKDEFACTDPAMLRQRFFDETLVPGRTALGHPGPNSPRSDFLEDGIGGALHELGHLFGLTHHSRGATNNIMSQGFRNLRWNVGSRKNLRLAARFSSENADMLMASRFLNVDVDRSDNSPPTVDLSLESRGRSLFANVTASDDKQLTLLSVIEVTKNQGRQLIQSHALSGKQQVLQLKIDAKDVKNSPPTIQIIVVDSGGNHRKVSKTYGN